MWKLRAFLARGRVRFSFRAFILLLASIYFLTMYIFHTDLEEETQARRNQVMMMQVGEEAYSVPVRVQRKWTPNVDMQQKYDELQKLQKDVAVAKQSAGVKGVNVVSDELEESFFMPNNAVVRNTSLDKPVGVGLDDYANFQSRDNLPEGCESEPPDQLGKFQRITQEIYLYSAFYDTRPNDFDNKHNGSYFRIMAIVKSKSKPNLECLFESPKPTNLPQGGWFANTDSRIRTSVTYYEMCENHNRPHGGFILSCRVPIEITSPPCVLNVTSGQVQVSLHVRTLKPVTYSHNFTICVPPLFGALALSRVVEFIETSSVIGADHFVFYMFNTHNDVRDLVEKYARHSGRVSLISWQLDGTVDSSIWYHGQLIAIQDCLYRNMATSRYVVFGDVDEYIVPHSVTYWSELVESIDHPSHCAYQFQSAFFDPNHANVTIMKEVGMAVHTQTAFTRSKSYNRIRAKCLVKPYQIFESGIHHISKPIWADLKVVPVDMNIAYLHHYRPCSSNMGMKCDGQVDDTSMLRYRKQTFDRLWSARRNVLGL